LLLQAVVAEETPTVTKAEAVEELEDLELQQVLLLARVQQSL